MKLYVAGGCFWGVEAFFQLLPGVTNTTVGYVNGSFPNPTYEDLCYRNSGHAETVKVEFDPKIISYVQLLKYFTYIIDPTSLNKQGNDIGVQYRTGIYYTNEDEKHLAEAFIAQLQREYSQPIAIEVKPLERFDDAEPYHQDYLLKNPTGYCHVNLNKAFTKVKEDLLSHLSPLAYEVTQKGATEPPFTSEYNNFFEEGIYVDIITGEPLFSSKDKFPCSCGWPAFARAIEDRAVTYHEDYSYGMHRIEVRSASSGNHLGHIFNDGPIETGGKRFCINGVALKFIPSK